MILCFELSMPNRGSWNGKWSGNGNYYAITKNMGRSKKKVKKAEAILKKGCYRYNFGDGWVAGVSVKQADAKEAAKIRRKSKGFSGYDWMVGSIISRGRIEPD